jgi:hypothetical protein
MIAVAVGKLVLCSLRRGSGNVSVICWKCMPNVVRRLVVDHQNASFFSTILLKRGWRHGIIGKVAQNTISMKVSTYAGTLMLHG